jgi:hypothetical protein
VPQAPCRSAGPSSEADDGFETVRPQRLIRHFYMLERPAAALCCDSIFDSRLFLRHDRCTRATVSQGLLRRDVTLAFKADRLPPCEASRRD